MQKLRVFVGVSVVLGFLFSFLVAGTEEQGPFLCDDSVKEVFWLNYPGACFELKAKCKGAAAGAEVLFTRSFDSFSIITEGTHPCAIGSTDDDQLVEALKGECSSDDAQTKLELKRKDDLCPVSCVKPDKVLGCGP